MARPLLIRHFLWPRPVVEGETVAVPFALECYLDPATREAVRDLWSRLDDVGVPSLGSVAGASYEPHITLAGFDDYEATLMQQAEEQLRSFVGLPVTLGHLGFFVTDEAPAFLAVVMTEGLLDSHRQLWATIRPLIVRASPYYEPDALVAHCTLAMKVADPEIVHRHLRPGTLPIAGAVESVNLVEITTGRALQTTR